MNLVIPMVGLGSRFTAAGYKDPKPLILAKGKPIVLRAIESFKVDANFIFVIRSSEYSDRLKEVLKNFDSRATIIEIDYLTRGSTSSILLCENLINNEDELITTNCDQEIVWDCNTFIDYARRTNSDGMVVTYPHENIELGKYSPYSFIEVDKEGVGLRLEEKLAISSLALCGVHYWKKGSDFVSSAKEMIKNNDTVNNEFYVSKSYNYLIKKNKVVRNFHLKKEQFYSLGTPEDLIRYESN